MLVKAYIFINVNLSNYQGGNMKKKILLCFMFALIVLCAFGTNNNIKAADLGDVDILIANPGEDSSTQMNFRKTSSFSNS